MARLSKENWLEEGIKILSEFAQDKIKILYLCERLEVTRGSFYHHFNSIENYVEELMKKWVRENTEAFIKAADQQSSPEEQMEKLYQLVEASDLAVEAAIRSWGFYSALVKSYVDKVDQMRIEYLTEIFQNLGYSKHQSILLSKLEIATLAGIQQMFPRIGNTELREMYDLYNKSRYEK